MFVHYDITPEARGTIGLNIRALQVLCHMSAGDGIVLLYSR